MKQSEITRRGALLLGVGALSACAAPGRPAPSSRKSRDRNIPLSLWLGAGDPDETWPTGDVVSGSKKNRRIRGPFEWTDPRTGAQHLVYERTKTSERRLKRQIYTIVQDGQGLGRLLDERTGRAPRSFEGEIIFPLGVWKRGERRKFRATEYTVIGPARREIEIRIRRLDYRHRGVRHSLKYDWIMRDAAGRTLFRERFIYSPGKGLVKFRDLLQDKAKRKKKARREKDRKPAG